LRQYLIAKHGLEEVEKMFSLMDEIFIKSLQSVQKIIINDKHCFELYGYDILLDANLKP
jgi:tubulin polyglutamylase TTLL9